MKSISVIGTGYLGATHAACLAELGFQVVGVDRDHDKVSALNVGELPFFEPGLEELVRRHLTSGRLRFTADLGDVAEADLHFVCVGTPQSVDGLAADTGEVTAAVEALLPLLRSDTVLVGKSTVPVGTASLIQGLVDTLAPPGVEVHVAWNPEFLREGCAVEDTLRPDRLVFGVAGEQGEKALREVYASLVDAGVPVVVTDLVSAELVKTAANAFLATKISFINAVAELCEASGGDVTSVADALGHDPRIGSQFLRAGLGFGGGCLPKDIRALMARAGELGVDQALTFLREVDSINMRRRSRVVDLVAEELGGDLLGGRVGVLGAAFKPLTDDVRDSPALNVAAQLQLRGAVVSVYDPEARDNARRLFPTLHYSHSVEAALAGADVVLHVTEWEEFAGLDPATLAGHVRGRVLVDARNSLDAERWRDAGWVVRAPGRPRLAPTWHPSPEPALL